MCTTENKTKDQSTAESEDAPKQDAGLSSAMHDMRVLAERYAEDREVKIDRFEDLPAFGAAIDPRVLLLPMSKPRTDHYRIAMLAMMVLVGLSTSAIAVRMAFQATPAQTAHAADTPLPAPTQPSAIAPVLESVLEKELERLGPTAQAPYELTRSPARTGTHAPSRPIVTPEAPKVAPKRIKTRINSKRRSQDKAAFKASTDSQCDEVACLLGLDASCCGKESGDDYEGGTANELEGRPYRLTRREVMEPMQSVLGRVRSCADNHDFQGIATVKIVIAANGGVKDFELAAGSEAFQSCVQGHVAGLRFPLLRQPFTVSYPFTLR